MKFLKRPKGAITFLLVALLVVSCFLIVRLELKAASLQSRLDEHHNELMDNSDILTQLKAFWRKVQNNFIVIDENMVWLGSKKSTLMMKGNEFNVNMSSGKLNLELSEAKKLVQLMNGSSKISMEPENIEITTKDFGFHILPEIDYLQIVHKNHVKFLIDANRNSSTLANKQLSFLTDSAAIYLTDKGEIKLKVTDNIRFGYSKNEERLYMRYNDSKLFIGKLQIEGGKEDFGAALIGKSGEQIQVRDEGVFLAVPTQEGTYHINLASKKKFIEIVKGNSIIRMEGEDISIEALGDINITSKNGKVNINGKR